MSSRLFYERLPGTSSSSREVPPVHLLDRAEEAVVVPPVGGRNARCRPLEEDGQVSAG